MQSPIGTVPSPGADHRWEVLARAARHLRFLAMAERPPVRWSEMKPLGLEREDSSLTQEQLEILS